MVFGREEEVALGFANFKEKENPFTRVGSSSAIFGSSNSPSTTAIPDNPPPPANTSENVGGGVRCSGLFGMPTTNSLPTSSSSSSAPVVDIQPRPLFSFWASDTHPPNSTSAFGQPSNPFSGSQTTTGGQPSLFGVQFPSSNTSFNRGGPHDLCPLGDHSPFSSSISSLNAVSQSSGQHPSGSSLFTHSISSLPTVSQSGGQHSSGSSLFTHNISSLPTVCQSSGLHSSGWSPFSSGISTIPAVSQAGGQQSSGWSPFSSVVSSSPAVSLADGQHSSSWSPFSSGISSSLPFGVPLPSSTPLFNVDPLPSLSVNPFNSDSTVTTSPFQTRLPPFQTRLPFSGLVVPTVDSRLRASTTSSTGPFTKSLVQENSTSSDCSSVFAPFTKGTTVCSYALTPPFESSFHEVGNLSSISAMPIYKEKSHEELRLEDYQLGLIPTSTSSGANPFFRFPNKLSTDSLPSSIPLSIEIRHLGDLLATTQITIPVPTSGTVPASNRATVTDAIITSIPEPVSTGGFRWSPDNRQRPAEPVGTEATDTLPTTVANESRPLVEKCKPDDEDVKFRKFFDVMAMIPKLKCPGYYTVPSVGDLIENELKKPGSCSQVKDFVIGKRGYGSIKFLGETDVRNLDLESMVQFNTREVIFCMDQKTKPPIGQGLNKAAEITLKVDCIDKNTGKRYVDGPKVDKYKELLVRKTMEQGAEFVSFDPAKGEWRFKVQHF